MSARLSFDDALDAAIDAVMRGEHVDAVVSRFPAHAETLRPLVELAYASKHDRASALPASPRLATNFVMVAGAAQRARLTAVDAPPEAQPPPWWRQKLAFASMSIPAGLVALLAVAGISGAAAASVAVTSDTRISDQVADVARAVTPDWIDGGGSRSPASGAGATDGGNAASPSGHAPVVAPPLQGESGNQNTPPGPPQMISESGLIGELHGSVFTLTNGDGEFHVNVDASTAITGAIADGATATVTGDLSGGQNLHAVSVEVTAAAAFPPEQDHPEGNGAPGSPSENAPGQLDGRTPGNSTSDHTPGPQPDRTPGPPGDHTPQGSAGQPPGQSTAAPPGQQNGNNGNGGTSQQDNGNGGGSKKP